MRKLLLLISFTILVVSAFAQDDISTMQNSADKMLGDDDKKLKIGSYGQIDLNQRFSGNTRYNGKLDVHRMVVFLGYQFTKNIQLVSEIEFEHVNELYVEQAFINYRFNDFLSLRGGLMLVNPIVVIFNCVC